MTDRHNVKSFEYLIGINTRKSVPELAEDEVQLVFENQNTKKQRLVIVKKDSPEFLNQAYRLKPRNDD